ncbi:MAG: helix-turn-helix transcriptional regulator [Planctomycetaceae bacterium]|nr:helix-turn-helix transcriptional regulator [Planctomycetaceae bacterium]
MRELRRSRGMTQAELARLAQITTSYVGRLESGGAAPEIDLVDRLWLHSPRVVSGRTRRRLLG